MIYIDTAKYCKRKTICVEGAESLFNSKYHGSICGTPDCPKYKKLIKNHQKKGVAI